MSKKNILFISPKNDFLDDIKEQRIIIFKNKPIGFGKSTLVLEIKERLERLKRND